MCELIIVFITWGYDWSVKAEKTGKKKQTCTAWVMIIVAAVQLISVFIFLGNYARTDSDYQTLLASSAQLSDFNGCGDSYMRVDPTAVASALKQSQGKLFIGLIFSILTLICLVPRSFALGLRVMRLCKPPPS